MKKGFLEELIADVTDIKRKNFLYYSTKYVPSRHDNSFTFERGLDKVGKEIETTVLYVDIRNSVELNRKHHIQTMGRIYTAFTKCVLKIARNHGGSVRNIIGDRVMIVFPTQNCFTNAVNCAISINHASKYVIAKIFPEVDFKCGIGIDYGKMNVVKVGLHRIGEEGYENRNLVWVGYPANIASRLTDIANKTIESTEVEVIYYPYIPSFPIFTPGVGLGRGNFFEGGYSKTPSTIVVDELDFVKKIDYGSILGITYSGGKLERFKKIKKSISYRPILITKAVYDGFKKENPQLNALKWLTPLKNHNIKNVSLDIYHADIYWKFD